MQILQLEKTKLNYFISNLQMLEGMLLLYCFVIWFGRQFVNQR